MYWVMRNVEAFIVLYKEEREFQAEGTAYNTGKKITKVG